MISRQLKCIGFFFVSLLMLCIHIPCCSAEGLNDLVSESENQRLSKMDIRIKYEKELLQMPFAILPHNPSYLLPFTYNVDPNEEMADQMDFDIQTVEMKYQLSLKVALLRQIFKENGYLYFGYTQQSYWQAYNSLHSAPFRETNYEPELMLSFFNDYSLGFIRNRLVSIGIAHQSNGKGLALSRSWNRVYADFVFESGNFCIGIKPWVRIHEERQNDDNPDIDEFMGHGEFRLSYFFGKNTFSALVRNNMAIPNRMGTQFDWSFPLTAKVSSYVQYYGGYGENLIDYDHINYRLGAGIMIASWF